MAAGAVGADLYGTRCAACHPGIAAGAVTAPDPVRDALRLVLVLKC